MSTGSAGCVNVKLGKGRPFFIYIVPLHRFEMAQVP